MNIEWKNEKIVVMQAECLPNMRNIDEMTSKRSHVYSISRTTSQYTTSSRSHGGYMNLFFYKHMNPSGSYSRLE